MRRVLPLLAVLSLAFASMLPNKSPTHTSLPISWVPTTRPRGGDLLLLLGRGYYFTGLSVALWPRVFNIRWRMALALAYDILEHL